MSLPLHTILMEHAHIDGEFFSFPIEYREMTCAGEKSGVTFIRVSRAEFEQLVNIYEAMVHDEEDQPVERAAP